jgi:pyridoxamine---pyruvate transaminase
VRAPAFTLSAGPTTVSSRTLTALGDPDRNTYHYDPAFLDTFRSAEAKAATVLGTSDEVLLLQGEAMLGLEAAVRSLVQPGLPVLNLVSGVFGRGMGAWLREFGAKVHEIEVPYNDAVDPDEVAEFLDEHPEIRLLCVVHSETPSGTFNDLSRIGPIARSHGVVTLVDCVSSVGGMPFDAGAWQLDVCVTAPQKCLGGTPGLSLVSVSAPAWALISENTDAPRMSYLSLLDWHERWHGSGVFPYTPSVAEVCGLEAALGEALEEGLAARVARHDLAARACRAGVRAMGLPLWPKSDEVASSCVTAVVLPDNVGDLAFRDYVRARYGVMLSGGQGAGNLVRIGHMGPTASGLYPVIGLTALGRGLADAGLPARIGEGVEAAAAVLAEAGQQRWPAEEGGRP